MSKKTIVMTVCDFCGKELSKEHFHIDKSHPRSDGGGVVLRNKFLKNGIVISNQDFCGTDCFIGWIRREAKNVWEEI